MTQRSPGPVDLSKFTLRDMTDVGSVLRRLGHGARSMEEVAGRIVAYLYDHTLDRDSGQRSCVLLRFFKTHAYGDLGPELRKFADAHLGGLTSRPDMKCLVLLGTAGERPEWNSRKASVAHQAIPLPSPEILAAAPMISSLMTQLGVEVRSLLRPEPRIMVTSHPSSFNVFYVPEALGSPLIPAQDDFVVPFGIRSVLGFGGMLPRGDIFALILFSRDQISSSTAELFKTLALNAKLAVMDYEEAVFE